MFKLDEDGVIVRDRPFVRSSYNYDMDAFSLLSGLECTDETRTQQQFKEECDINTIVERFGLTGELPNNLRVPITGDFTEVFDYQSALNRLMEADDAFMQMPAAVRETFANDAGKFVDFVSNPENVEQCRKWGLASPVAAPSGPIEVTVIPGVQEPPKTP